MTVVEIGRIEKSRAKTLPKPKGSQEAQCVECGAIFATDAAFDSHFKHSTEGLLPIDREGRTVYALPEDDMPEHTLTIRW